VRAFTVICWRRVNTHAIASKHPQIRHSWLISAAHVVGFIKKYRATTSYVRNAPVTAMSVAPNNPAKTEIRLIERIINVTELKAALKRGPQ
jgi:hypothetical protein